MKHIAFDLDGVLVDTDELHKVAVNEAIAAIVGRGKIITDDEHLKTFKGLPTKRKMFLLRQMGRIDDGQGESISNLKQVKTRAAIKDVIRPQLETISLLRHLKLTGYRMGVCTNSILSSTELMIEAAGLRKFFEFTISNEDVSRPKPDPEMYLKAAHLFNIKPSELIVVEDGEAGRRAAMTAGTRLVAVRGPEEVNLDLLPRIEEQGGK